jgi:hypothetical protein
MKRLADFNQADMEKTIQHNSATGTAACVVKGYNSTGLGILVQYSRGAWSGQRSTSQCGCVAMASGSLADQTLLLPFQTVGS